MNNRTIPTTPGTDRDLQSLFRELLPTKTTIGFERLIETALGNANPIATFTYPPYNILRTDRSSYRLEVAVAGFTADDVDVTVDQDKLVITGTKKKGLDPSAYVHQGIAARDWSLTFLLAENTVVKSADLVNGILTVDFERIIPENKKPKKIPIGPANRGYGDIQFLAESETPDRGRSTTGQAKDQFVNIGQSSNNIC